MKEPTSWNHNTAYYSWIKKQLSGFKSVLDVGCGDGSLLAYLDDGSKELVGIDIAQSCIDKAKQKNASPSISYSCCSFDEYEPDKVFDAIVFVASIHHMNMRRATEKAKTILAKGGVLLIVGLAKPASFYDYITEGLRVIPCRIISTLKHMKSSEEEDIPVSYDLPTMTEVRNMVLELLPESEIKYGLYYRYLLKWVNRSDSSVE